MKDLVAHLCLHVRWDVAIYLRLRVPWEPRDLHLSAPTLRTSYPTSVCVCARNVFTSDCAFTRDILAYLCLHIHWGLFDQVLSVHLLGTSLPTSVRAFDGDLAR